MNPRKLDVPLMCLLAAYVAIGIGIGLFMHFYG